MCGRHYECWDDESGSINSEWVWADSDSDAAKQYAMAVWGSGRRFVSLAVTVFRSDSAVRFSVTPSEVPLFDAAMLEDEAQT